MQNNNVEEKKLPVDVERHFNLPWLDSSYYETILPVTPWQNVNI